VNSLLKKLFCNEKGDVSLRKIGSFLTAAGGVLMAGTIPGAQFVAAGKVLAGIGAAILSVGISDKIDRGAEKTEGE
jgi:hypothetical protein